VVLQEEIQKKTGYIVMRAEGVFDVDANTSIDQLSEDLNIKMPDVHHFFIFNTCILHIGFLEINYAYYSYCQGHQYETVSGFVCEAFGYIPRTGESIKIDLERDDEDDEDDTNGDHQEPKEKKHIFKLEVIILLL
jgi:Mg2+/Co2+ transporter CorC